MGHTDSSLAVDQHLTQLTMNFTVALFLGMVAIVAAAPYEVFNFVGENSEQVQVGEPGVRVEGSYSYVTPEGNMIYVRYIADELGYRIVESNALPVGLDGIAADGNQGAFGSYEDNDSSNENEESEQTIVQ